MITVHQSVDNVRIWYIRIRINSEKQPSRNWVDLD